MYVYTNVKRTIRRERNYLISAVNGDTHTETRFRKSSNEFILDEYIVI